MKRLLLLFTICLSSVSFGQVPNYVPTNGLVGWWGFNGNANDESGNGNNGTVNGATLTTDRFGNPNSAYDFDGNDLIDVSSMFDYQERTTNLWLTCTDPNWGGITRLAFDNDNSNMSYGLVQFGTGVGQPDSIGMVQGNQSKRNFGVLGTWYMCSIIRDSDSVRFYFNGVLTSTKAVGTAASVINNIPTRIGGRVDNTRYWLGKIDDLGIWNRALTECEIQDLYDGSLGNCCTQNPITTQPTDVTVPLNGTGMFSTTTSVTSPTYQWQMDNGTGYMNLTNAGQFSGVDTDMLTVSNVTLGQNNTLFRCIVTENSNCSDTTDVAVLTVEDNTGIEELNQQISIYPNPTSTSFTITSKNSINSSFKLIDIQGKVVLTGKIESTEETVDISKLSKGQYNLIFEDESIRPISIIKN